MRTDQSFDNTIPRAVNGDRHAIQQLLLQHYDRLETRVAAQLPQALRSVVHVEDLVQETFVHAIRSMPQCKATNAESFNAWLDAIANNRVRDMIRLLKCQKRGGIRKATGFSSSTFLDKLCRSDSSTPGRNAARHEVIERVKSAIADLPSDQRLALQVRYLQGEGLDETARIIERSPNAIRGLIHRAKKRLREVMQSSSRWFDKK